MEAFTKMRLQKEFVHLHFANLPSKVDFAKPGLSAGNGAGSALVLRIWQRVFNPQGDWALPDMFQFTVCLDLFVSLLPIFFEGSFRKKKSVFFSTCPVKPLRRSNSKTHVGPRIITKSYRDSLFPGFKVWTLNHCFLTLIDWREC